MGTYTRPVRDGVQKESMNLSSSEACTHASVWYRDKETMHLVYSERAIIEGLE